MTTMTIDPAQRCLTLIDVSKIEQRNSRETP